MDKPAMDTNFYLLERAFVTLVSTMIEEGKLKPRIRNHREFASIAFPDKGEKTWKHIRIGQKGKAQALQVQDALAIAKAVGIPFSELLIRAKIMVETGWSLDMDPAHTHLDTSATDAKKTLADTGKGANASVKNMEYMPAP